MLDLLPGLDPEVSVSEMRAMTDQASSGGDRSVVATNRTIPGPAGDIPVRLYLPPGDEKLHPLVVFFHGGGWVIGSLDSHDALCRDLAARADAAILSVDYRLAPEHPFPAAVEDSWAALRWVHDHASELGADPARLAVAGDSAGGNLAAVMAFMARDHQLTLRLQLLTYPATDLSSRRPSVTENGEGYLLTEAAMDWFEAHYAPDRNDWRASPMLAPDHRHLAPAMIQTCEYDPLRDEGNDYAETLRSAGVPVVSRCYQGLIHGSLNFAADVPAARIMLDDACQAIREAMAIG
jgi:acetyl esterase/lipase